MKQEEAEKWLYIKYQVPKFLLEQFFVSCKKLFVLRIVISQRNMKYR